MQVAKSELGINFLELNWDDTTAFAIPPGDFARCAQFIHAGRSGGGSVLVHCAQVRGADPTAELAAC